MTFEVKLSSQATKFLRNQDRHIAERLKTALRKLKDPFSVLERFEGDLYKYRIGDYRALCDVDEKTVWVRVLEHRGNVYK